MKKKVVHIINDLRMGGVSSVLYSLVKDHKNSTYSYEILNLSGIQEPEMLKLFESTGIAMHCLNYQFEDGYGLKDQFKKAFLIRKYMKKNQGIVDFIANLKADVLHFHTLPRELMLGRIAAKKAKCELVFTDHSMRISSNEIKKISKLLIRYPFREFYRNYNVIAVSDSVKKYLDDQKISSVLRSLKVINNKIPDVSFRIKYTSKVNLNFVYVSRISLVKGHKDLIQAWSLLPEMNLTLHIVGPDEMNGSIQKLAKSLTCKNKIVFTGPLTNVGEFLTGMDAGVFPSHREGLPVALLEMMQVGLPCVVSDIDEIKNIVSDQKNCLQFKCGDSESLAEQIIKLAKSEKLRERIGISAAKLVQNQYSQRSLSLREEYELTYNAILN
ncbi:MAG: glycosyltransferase family 4 protein [Bacteroidota bacterium]|nr:glycosyltransferase family 4 protein [Bacteroidota bacterium]